MSTQNRNDKNGAPPALSRRSFLSKGAAAGVGAAALTGATATDAQAQTRWDLTADVVVIGAGVAGPAGRHHGTRSRRIGDRRRGKLRHRRPRHAERRAAASRRRQRHPAEATASRIRADQVYADWVRFDSNSSRYSDRDLVRVFADENVPTYDFLVENGVEFIDKMIGPEAASTIPRTFVTVEWHVPSEIVAPRRNRNGSGLVRRLEASARKKGAQILLRHKMTEHHPRAAELRPRARHHGDERDQSGEHQGQARASSSLPAATPAT